MFFFTQRHALPPFARRIIDYYLYMSLYIMYIITKEDIPYMYVCVRIYLEGGVYSRYLILKNIKAKSEL